MQLVLQVCGGQHVNMAVEFSIAKFLHFLSLADVVVAVTFLQCCLVFFRVILLLIKHCQLKELLLKFGLELKKLCNEFY